MNKKNAKINIAIDGPAGVGKTTVSIEVAKHFNYIHIDSGSIYRALTYKALLKDIDFHDNDQLSKLLKKTKIRYVFSNNRTAIFLDRKDITQSIRSKPVTLWVPYLAKIKKVRDTVFKLQKQLSKRKGIVMEGRDIGTMVLPKADLKIFLNASIQKRVDRRYKELKNKYKKAVRKEIEREIIKRDRLDKRRKYGPLRKSIEAIEINTNNITMKEVVKKIIDLIPTKLQV